MQVHIGSLLMMIFAVSKQQQWLQPQPFCQKQCTMQFADEQSVWRDAELCSFSVMRIFKKIVSFFVVSEQVSKCLVFLRNVRLGIDKLINVYQNSSLEAFNVKYKSMYGGISICHKAVFFRQLKIMFFIITNWQLGYKVFDGILEPGFSLSGYILGFSLRLASHLWRSARMQCAPLLVKSYGCLDAVL